MTVFPPRPVRRLVLAPLIVVLAAAVTVLFPLLALLAWLGGLPGGRGRALRLLFVALAWLTAETSALFTCLGLWVASGFGGRLHTEPYQARHYAVMQRFLDRVYHTATTRFGVRVEVEEPELTRAEQAARLARPVIVLSRHAGPGDSFLLVHHLLSQYGRRPRVVMKASLQFDPFVDVVANRLPNVFVSPRRTGGRMFSEQIARLARGLGRSGALVIFPEGGNWTPARWHRGIGRLERQGRRDLAARARQMPNLLPPRAGGVLAAVTACPDADVIFVAHSGLEHLISVADVWRRPPVNQVIRARWWRVPAGEVPRLADRDVQTRWLYDWWHRIDRWISQSQATAGTTAAASTEGTEQGGAATPPVAQGPGD